MEGAAPVEDTLEVEDRPVTVMPGAKHYEILLNALDTVPLREKKHGAVHVTEALKKALNNVYFDYCYDADESRPALAGVRYLIENFATGYDCIFAYTSREGRAQVREFLEAKYQSYANSVFEAEERGELGPGRYAEGGEEYWLPGFWGSPEDRALCHARYGTPPK